MTDILNPTGAPAAPAQPAAPAAPAAPATDPSTGQPVAAAPSAPAAPAAPVQPEAPAAPVVEPASTKDDKTGVVTYEPTGDVGLDLALEFFGKLGLDFESPEMQEAGKGNFAYLEAKLAALGDKAQGSDRYLALAKDAYGRLQANDKSAYEARKAIAHEAVGGEETWNSIQEFVKANAEPEELEQVKAAMLQGGVVAKAMAEHLHRLYLASSGTVAEPASATRHQPTAPAGGAPLTRQGYLEEMNALVAKIGSHRLDGSPEYAALRKKYANLK